MIYCARTDPDKDVTAQTIPVDPFELAGIRVKRASDVQFITRGAYGRVRHPIYTGWILAVFATSPMTMTRLVFAVVSGLYNLIAIPLEERTLVRASGGAYDGYRGKVRWKLVPGLY